ncbi:hypothetical protein GGR53DRAFT_107685 [Hypoxylon sp. FL1150]|nr:hypothetical protein GGR53DRAFT_107685 [Hypoxylon sp. FL1150]
MSPSLCDTYIIYLPQVSRNTYLHLHLYKQRLHKLGVRIYLQTFNMENIVSRSTRCNPPGSSFASPTYIAAQLASTAIEHLPSVLITALPHAPQFGSHFGLSLLTKQAVRACEALAMQHCNTVLHIPITRHWPHGDVAPPGSQLSLTEAPFLWGYYDVGDEAEAVPIIKSKRRPNDEWVLNDLTLPMPIRSAIYSGGKLGPWTYKIVQRREVAMAG